MTVLDACYREQDARCLKMVYAAMNALIADLRGEGEVKQGSQDRMSKARDELRRKAFRFIIDDSIEPYSFLWMCSRLDASPEHIINAYNDGSIKEWQAREWEGLGTTFLLKRV